jgi:hypothetical protein
MVLCPPARAQGVPLVARGQRCGRAPRHPVPGRIGLRTCGRLRDGRVRPERGREGTRPSPTELVRRGDRGAWAHDPLHRIEAGTGPAVAATHTPTRRASVSPAPGSETRSPITDHRSPITDHRGSVACSRASAFQLHWAPNQWIRERRDGGATSGILLSCARCRYANSL